MTDPLVYHGRLVTFDPARPVIDDGALYVGGDERIHAVQSASDPAPAGFGSARRVRTRGTIYPGLMDLHSHMVYNALPLWTPPGVTQPFTSRYQWPRHGSYEQFVSDPANALGALSGKGLLKYVEAKAVVGGVTAIQGSAKMAYPYDGWLVRNVEYETFQTGQKSVFQSALPLKGPADYKKQSDRMKRGSAFIYHLSEGTDAALVSEYDTVRDNDCLLPGFNAIHCTALGRPNYDEWAPKGGSIVWSPFSNLWLYADTTDVAAARDAGMNVCLGSDWSPSGTKNLLGEIKVADLWNQRIGRPFSDRELCEMATCNPAEALRWDDRLGRLRAGLHGDVLVLSNRHDDAYRNLIEATERDVEYVAINNQPFYGTNRMMRATGATRDDPIRVGRLRRRIVLEYPGIKDADWGWAETLADLALALLDPIKRYLEIEKFHKAGRKPPPWLKTDKPWDDPDITGKPVAIDVQIPPLDPLAHDAAWLRAVERNPLHGGILDGLRNYY